MNNIPISLFSQAGVALGLAAYAYSRLLAYEGAELTAIRLLEIVTVSVLIAEVVGPILLKFALTRAGEVGKNNTRKLENGVQGCTD